MNPGIDRLQPYPFEKLAALKAGLQPPADLTPINLSIGEPAHAAPGFVQEEIMTHLHGLCQYPATRGGEALRRAIAEWLQRRYRLPREAVSGDRNVLPVNGTREALFAFAQCIVDRDPEGLVVMPNPFYQIYEGAAVLAGAQPWYWNTTADNGWLPDIGAVPDDVWRRCQLVYLCSPGNPTGAVMELTQLQELIGLAERYDFVIAADECYAEIYLDEDAPPCGILEAAAAMGVADFRRCMTFHSLSKRSNLPGLRSGFVAGDPALIAAFLRYRTYHGCAMPPFTQAASIAAWNDEDHVRENRALYREKFAAVLEVLNPAIALDRPAAGFYLWLPTPGDDADFARELHARKNVSVLPGSFLSREAHGINPGSGRVRIALVAELEECLAAAHRIRDFVCEP